jgi:hypothetical protein
LNQPCCYGSTATLQQRPPLRLMYFVAHLLLSSRYFILFTADETPFADLRLSVFYPTGCETS